MPLSTSVKNVEKWHQQQPSRVERSEVNLTRLGAASRNIGSRLIVGCFVAGPERWRRCGSGRRGRPRGEPRRGWLHGRVLRGGKSSSMEIHTIQADRPEIFKFWKVIYGIFFLIVRLRTGSFFGFGLVEVKPKQKRKKKGKKRKKEK